MQRLTRLEYGVALIGMLVGSLMLLAAAPAATAETITIAVAALAQVNASTHNAATSVCGLNVPSSAPEEFNGVIVNGKGSYIGWVHLPDGATVTAFYLNVHDNDGDTDGFAYLARKYNASQSTFLGGYSVMAKVRSNGASAPVRRFRTMNITNAVIDNIQYGYLVEVINCGNVEMLDVQIDYTP